MKLLHPLHGETPTFIQLAGTYGVAILSAGLVLLTYDLSLSVAVLAVFAADWAGGVIANSSEPVRAWWRSRPRARAAFYVVHALEIPIIWWASPDRLVFAILLCVLAAKLLVFHLGALAKSDETAHADN